MIPEIEKKMGIELYCTDTEGIGGVLRQDTDDFIVRENTNRQEGDSGKYIVIEMTKKNWDMHHLIRDISRKLGISQKRIGFAGTKDKRAKTTQKISIFDVSEKDIDNLYIKDVEMKVIGRSNRSLGLGDLYGNEFIITIRDIDCGKEKLQIIMAATTDKIIGFGGVPNFFGIQRFGTIRPVIHVVGEQLLKGNFQEAAMTYIARSFPDESDEVREIRDHVFKTLDFAYGIKEYPLRLRYERAMMHYLVNNPGDFAGSFSVLSENISKMFIHAYQSYIFNRIICKRIECGLTLDRANTGDIICFRNKEGLPDAKKVQKATEENVDGMNNLLKKGRAFVTAPLIGYKTDFASGKPGEIEENVFRQTGIQKEAFQINLIPELASKGLRREILLHCRPDFETSEDELNPGKRKVVLSFSLPKGSYATTVLREYMKTDPLRMS